MKEFFKWTGIVCAILTAVIALGGVIFWFGSWYNEVNSELAQIPVLVEKIDDLIARFDSLPSDVRETLYQTKNS